MNLTELKKSSVRNALNMFGFVHMPFLIYHHFKPLAIIIDKAATSPLEVELDLTVDWSIDRFTDRAKRLREVELLSSEQLVAC